MQFNPEQGCCWGDLFRYVGLYLDLSIYYENMICLQRGFEIVQYPSIIASFVKIKNL